MTHILIRVVIGAALLHVPAAPLRAAVVYVNQNAPGGTNNGASWGTAFLTIPQGLAAAQPYDEVWVAKGTYPAGISIPGNVALLGGFAGTETDRRQRDPRRNPTLLIAGSSGLVDCPSDGATVSGFEMRGATIRITADHITVADNRFLDTSIGIFMQSGSVTLIRNVFTGISATALYCMDATSISLFGNTFSGSQAAIDARVSAGATLVGNTISGNVDSVSVSARDLRFTNNLVAFNGLGARLAADEDVLKVISHNNVYGNGRFNYSGTDYTGRNGNISADPKLSDIYRDVHLQPDSPCRDAADMETVSYTHLDVYKRQV